MMNLSVLEPVVGESVRRDHSVFLRGLSGADFDPHYSDAVRRFEVRDTDVLALPGDARVERDACGVAIVSAEAQARVVACGLTHADAARALGAIDGRRTVAEARHAAGIGHESWDRVVRAAFGKVLFAPSAVAALEDTVSGSEIVRFVGSPYEIVRSYWENMACVRARLDALEGAVASTAAFVRWIRELHAVALVGESGRTFYRPASAVAEQETTGAGDFLLAEAAVRRTPSGTWWVAGPRIAAVLVGGARYHQLLIESVGDPDALGPVRVVADDSGLGWGRVVTARTEEDERQAPRFCPTRPFLEAHFDALRGHLSGALHATPEEAVPRLAEFHWSFVRAHPFASGNQCIAMSVVNHLLRRSHGAGMPHHVLDHLALRLSREAYVRVFRRATQAWICSEHDPVRRTFALVERKHRALGLLRDLESAPSSSAARRLVEERPDDARLILVCFPPEA